MPPYNIPKVELSKKSTIEMADDRLPNNSSEQRLVAYGEGSTPPLSYEPVEAPPPPITRKHIVVVAVLCYVNLINYMDRFTIAGVLPAIEGSLNMNKAQAGLLQTAFVLTYMIMAPTFGYLGDRFNRKYLMAFGVFFWSLTTLIGSFMPNYEWFLLCRCLVGVGEASYSTIAPTLISDMFIKDQRSMMLAIFYFAIPVGSGLGYIVGSEVSHLADTIAGGSPESWRWGLRMTPIMGILAVAGILYFLKDPPRGGVEGGDHLKTTSFWNDLKYLASNKSYVFSTLAFTCVTFVAGALSWWGPSFVQLGVEVQEHPNADRNSVPMVFGAVAMMAGVVGVPLGSYSGQFLRKRWSWADPMVCGFGLFFAFPFLVGAMALSGVNTIGSYIVVFFGQVFLNLNWAVVSDIVLYIIIPTRRSSAEAFQILFSHALGDAGSPYLVGLMSDYLKPWFKKQNATITDLDPLFLNTLFITTTADPTDPTATTTVTPDMDDKFAEFQALQVSLYFSCAFLLFGAFMFFINACFITQDKLKADRTIAGLDRRGPGNSLSAEGLSNDLIHSSGGGGGGGGGSVGGGGGGGGSGSDNSSVDESLLHPTNRYADEAVAEQSRRLILSV